ncbi:hypothetical protein ABPG74_020452 [Tetrahymena malaccensis]
MYSDQTIFAQIQNDATLQMFFTLMQKDTIYINLIQRVNEKMMNGKINQNPKFKPPLLNVYDTYNNFGDQYLLNLYRYNSSYLISSWHSKDTNKLEDLHELSFDQIRNATFIDFIWKAVLFNEVLGFKQNLVNIKVKLYFMAFQSDGMFYGAGINITTKNIIDPYPCPKSSFHLDSRCQEYFQEVIQTVQFQSEGYIPTHFLYTIDNQPYIGLGLCKKTYINQSFMEKYRIPFNLTQAINPFSIVCHSINLEQSVFNFQNVGNQKAIRILIDPFLNRVAYQSDVQIQANVILTLQESYISRLQSDDQKKYFLEQVNQFKLNHFIRFCSSDKQYIFSQQFNQTIQQFTINNQNQKIIVILQFTYYIDKILVTKEEGDIEVQYCFKNSLLLLTILTQDQLQSQAITLSQQIIQINRLFRVFLYGFTSLSVLISFYYSQKISKMIGNSLQHLTGILKKLKVDQETKNFILFEDGMLSGNLQIDHSEFLFSSDLSLLYESFQNLFQTLIYTTQSLFDQDESQILINLTTQVSYFQQFKNYRALGICYNNIANIHFNNSRYLEALENYSQSIIYSKYELKIYQHTSYKNYFKNYQDVSSNLREKKSRSSVFNLFIDKINSISIFKSKVEKIKKNKLDFKFQEDILMNFQKYGIYEIQKEKNELNQMLFNRKYNFIRALIFHTLNQNSFLLYSDIFESLTQELVNLRNPDQAEGYKQKIVLNQLFQFIYFQQRKKQKCEQIVQENSILHQYLKQISILKPQNIQQKDQKTNEEQTQKENLHTHTVQQYNSQLNQSNNLTPGKFQLKTKIQTKLSPEVQQNQQQTLEFNHKRNNMLKPLNTQGEQATKEQENNLLNSYSPSNNETFLSFNKLLRENVPLELSNFRLDNKNKNDYCKLTQEIREKGNRQSNNLKINQFDSQKIISPKSISPFNTSKNQNQSLKTNKQSQLPQANKSNSPKLNLLENSNKIFSPKEKQSISQASCHNQSLYFTKSLQKYFSRDKQMSSKLFQEKNQQKYQLEIQNYQQNINDINDKSKYLDCLIKSKKKYINKINDNSDQEDTKMPNNSCNNNQNDFSERDNSYYSSFITNRSKIKLQYDCFGSDRNQYQINEDQIFNSVQEQIILLNLLQKNYYKAAKAITKIYEESKLVVSQQFSRSIQRLLRIFDMFGIDCQFLEQIYRKLSQNISFKICVVYQEHEQDPVNLSSRNELSESDQQLQTQDFNNLSNKAKLLDLSLDIIEQVLLREDDYFGFISSNLNDMSIKEHVSINLCLVSLKSRIP